MHVEVQRLFDWLVDGGRGTKNPVELLDRLCPELVRAGVPVDGMGAFVRTLHPHVVGRSFHWHAGAKVSVRENTYAYLNSDEFRQSAMAEVFRTGQPVRRRGAAGSRALLDLARPGVTDYLALPLEFMNGEVHGIAFTTSAPGGFDASHVEALSQIVRPLTRVGEIFALSRTAVNLLNTYVGRNAGERILAGHIQRGDTDSIRCVIWFSDLRGFTRMADSVAPGVLIRTLNELFDCQVPAIERHGGEVLKYMGDGMLAIFPIVGDPASACEGAVTAAGEAFGNLAHQNAERAARGDPALAFGLALHLGDVAYGNIGGAGRLDFTCIGPAVNLASRIEGLASKLGRDLLVSRDVAQHLNCPLVDLGEHELKGVAEPQRVFALGQKPPATASP